MRAFVAVPLGPVTLEAATRELERLRRGVPAVRWVRPEGLHLTLHFFENLEEARAGDVLAALRAPAAAAHPFEVSLDHLGAFPGRGPARVLWVGVGPGTAELTALAGACETALERAGFDSEPRAFHAHCTLGRPRMPWQPDGRRAWERWEAAPLPPFTADRLTLYRSHPGPGGSVYEVLGEVPLGA